MLIYIAIIGLALFALVAWFFALESTGERHKIFIVLGMTLLIESLLAGPAAEVPVGLLRPRLFGQDFRPPDVVIVAALAARLVVASGRRVSVLALPWAAFIGMYITGSVVGLLNGLPVIDVLFQSKGAFYIVGGMVVASGVDIDRLTSSIGKLGVAVAALVPIALVLDVVGLNLSLSTPVQRFNRLGRLSNDTITLLTLLGVLVLLTEATRSDRRLKTAIAGVVLLMAPAVGHQRASYLVVATVLIAFAAISFGATWRHRATATGVEVGLLGAGMMGLVIAGFALTSSPGVLIAPVQNAFGGEAEQRSAASRVSLIEQATAKIEESPIIGSGVGTKVVRQAQLSNREIEAAAHNLVFDLWMRVGAIGLLLFAVAVFATTSHGVRVWRRARDNATAVVAGAGAIIVWGVVTKGMVEPALDKFRLSLALGLGVGLVMAAVRRHDEAGVDERVPRASSRPLEVR